ncbi:hypothetical protein, partial [Enterobacter cloacae complex sp. 4DZ1-17B1]|uniref:hypothetical protein n=1 Tax=Enterobacter cloacae complex sp. 4DZ1-17B1 TaxID=2511991 RepID=UPI001CA4830A
MFTEADVRLHLRGDYIWRTPYDPYTYPPPNMIRHEMQSAEQNPNGFHSRYSVTKADGSPCDPDAIYFVLRVDSGGSDPKHIAACRAALLRYATQVIETAP